MISSEIIEIAERKLGFQPSWIDDGVSFLGIAIWIAPDGAEHVSETLKPIVEAYTKKSLPGEQ